MRRTFMTALALLVVAAPLAAGEVYSWKDARGVTHYSQTPPPPGTRFEVRNVAGRAAPTSASPAGAPATLAPAAASGPSTTSGDRSQCEMARANVAALQSDDPVQQVDADGTPRPLDAAARADQLALSQAAVRAYCR